ncbi:MAG: molybdopterin-dependent oxidoreductase, partial [Acidimicrobiia bacterium]
AQCGLELTVTADRVVGVRGQADHAVSHGYTCNKGRAQDELHNDPDRLDQPLMKIDGALRPVDWDRCLDDLGTRLAALVAEHGPAAVGFFHGGGMYNDAAGHWATNRLERAIRTPSIYSDSTVDSAAKWRVGELMAGTTSLLPHPDDEPNMLLLIGTNPVVSHGQTTAYPNPVERLRRARKGGPVWVIDPRFTESARHADRYLAIRPGFDHEVLGFLVREVMARGIDIDALALRADGIAQLRDVVEQFTLASVSVRSGLSVHELTELRDAVLAAGRLAIMTGTGTTMAAAGNLTEWMAWSLLVVTGSFDQPGGMWFNPGYLARLNERTSLPRATSGPGSPSRPDIPSVLGEWPAALISDEIESGRMKALFIMGAALLTTVPDAARLERALAQLDLVVCFDVIDNPTVQASTHVLACKSPLERPDVPLLADIFAAEVYTQYTPAVFPAKGERKAMWWILEQIARRLGSHVLPDTVDPDTATDEEILRLVAARVDLDPLIAAKGPVIREVERFGWAEAMLPDGVWHLAPDLLVAQMASHQQRSMIPLALIPRRQNRKMNYRGFGDRPDLLVNTADAERLGITDGARVEISTGNGAVSALAKVTDDIRPGAVSLPHAWPDANVNVLLPSADLDPLTGMALLSGVAVQLRPLDAVPT